MVECLDSQDKNDFWDEVQKFNPSKVSGYAVCKKKGNRIKFLRFVSQLCMNSWHLHVGSQA